MSCYYKLLWYLNKAQITNLESNFHGEEKHSQINNSHNYPQVETKMRQMPHLPHPGPR